MNYQNQSMMIIASTWNNTKSFKLIPCSIIAPYNEVIYDPEAKVLVAISKEKIERPQMLPKIDDKGRNLVYKDKENNSISAQTRVMMNAFYEHYIEDISDIVRFIDCFAVNPEHELYNDIIHSRRVAEQEASKPKNDSKSARAKKSETVKSDEK